MICSGAATRILYACTVLYAMTRMAEKRPSALMMSSVRPSLKNSRFGSAL